MLPSFRWVIAHPCRLDRVILQATPTEIVEGLGSRWRPEDLLAALDEGPRPDLPCLARGSSQGWRQRRLLGAVARPFIRETSHSFTSLSKT